MVRTSPFHGENMGSIPVRDKKQGFRAKKSTRLCLHSSSFYLQGPFQREGSIFVSFERERSSLHFSQESRLVFFFLEMRAHLRRWSAVRMAASVLPAYRWRWASSQKWYAWAPCQALTRDTAPEACSPAPSSSTNPAGTHVHPSFAEPCRKTRLWR